MNQNPRAFQQMCSIIYVILFLGCAAALVWSLIPGASGMRGFPVVFLLAAMANFLSAKIRFRPDRNRRNQKGAGILCVLIGLMFLLFAVVRAVCLWWR